MLSVWGCVLAGGGLAPPVWGQRLRTMRVPPNLRVELNAQGDRFERKGKERVALVGRLTDARGVSKPVTIMRDIRGRFRLAVQGRVVAFDGVVESSRGGGLSAEELAAAESLIDDSAEVFFAAVDRGDALRLIGRRFRADDGAAPSYAGPWRDIYELCWRGRGGRERPERVKYFYFDSATGLPERVRYEGVGGEVETLAADWREVAGQFVPLRITRWVGGRKRFSFVVDTVSWAADRDDGVFRAGN